ncbi:hypothetical protein G7046_g8109 [Stylonectria norvegica]|nr:hypothetical protein G7046_g8109 [Stylonectria norvegica]
MPESSSSSSAGTPPTSGSEATALVTTTTRRHPIPRKGHTKSRAGCSTCKKRKVKCDEIEPECGPCRRLGFKCEYLQAKKRREPGSLSLSPPLQTTPTMFDADDMRFFQHFLFEAYPPMPVDGFKVWQHISQLAHEYTFLMHAMLGLGASHLSLSLPVKYKKAALKHRVIAIKALNEHLSKPQRSMPDGEAALGATIALTFQSLYMTDGMTDFFSMVRGCYLMGKHSMPEMEESTFKPFPHPKHMAKIRELVANGELDQQLDIDIAEEFCASYEELSALNNRVGDLTAEDFTSFLDTNNHTCQLIIMHSLALGFVMSRKRGFGPLGFQKAHISRQAMSKTWIEQILKRLPVEYHPYAEWPVHFVRSALYSFDNEEQVWKPPQLGSGMSIFPPEDIAVPLVEWDPTASSMYGTPETPELTP